MNKTPISQFQYGPIVGWFDVDLATAYEATVVDTKFGPTSVATRLPGFRETLYQTSKGNWVRSCWSAAYYEVSPKQAVTWLILNGHTIPDELLSVADMMER